MDMQLDEFEVRIDEFAIRDQDGSWKPCDGELNLWLSRALADLLGAPGSIVVRDDDAERHVLSLGARHALELALRAMDARLHPTRYREKADEIYALLVAMFHSDGVEELRRIFQLGRIFELEGSPPGLQPEVQ